MEWKKLVSSTRVPAYNNDKSGNEIYAFESDYRRIIKSSSFRRLQDKTQVFPLDRNDFVRTRLTHSLEVAMISRDILNEVIRNLDKKDIDTEPLSKCHRLLECAALIHDIGNPPFGHFGEDAIRIWFENNIHKYPEMKDLNEQQQLDYLKFEGNAQTIRVLTKLHDYNGSSSVGMRLTASVLDSVIKYMAASNEVDKSELTYKKVGYFYSEQDVFKEIKEVTGSRQYRHPLVYLLEASDDISYTFSDLEDGFKFEMFSLADLKEYLQDCPEVDEILLSSKTDEEKMQEFIRLYQQKVFKYVSMYFVNHYDEIMKGTLKGDLFAADAAEIKVFNKLKKFCFEYIFEDKEIINQEIVGYNILNSLLDTFVPVVLKYGKEMNAYEEKLLDFIPKSAFQRYDVETKGLEENEKTYYKIKIAVDYICGMTDGFARKVYKDIFNT
ncbi:dGTPase [Breznakia sp. PF5-3]|uniref:deoxyguanosinetriphosphate triphosphohydrolase n=1 Tax=unclassified Breznakia TaxID=2623764 RepID=UPI0024057005|nr:MULTISPECIES: deoxyguanosinetriphosphate triphosphohydrolase [unclassified Breznakia]MDF9823838.1 dGTPase [Breznakia sp. PM6-1]MDF9834596.1 dGTPase [Breznakia sp. PF5-3]MDF9836787.1 dGTPase [Breznakia sp. PFB2-8]MDF9858764.1 dGTPase [Breznakia sp. PH5-24]